jgi:hypothetical protein
MNLHEEMDRLEKFLQSRPPVGFTGAPPVNRGGIQSFLNMIEAWKKSPKARVADPNNDPAFESRIAHVLKPGERIMQFVSRTFLGRTQALAMTRAEISNFVAEAEIRRVEEGSLEPHASFSFGPKQPLRAPQKFVMVG